MMRWFVVVAILVAPVAVSAQGREPRNFALERLRPAMDRAGILDAEWAGVPEHLVWDASVWVGYANNPLVLNIEVDGTTERVASIVSHRLGGNLTGSIGLFGWMQVGADVPLILFQARGDTLGDYNENVRTLIATGVGDLRLTPKVQILRPTRQSIGIALLTGLTLPTASARSYFGDRQASFEPEVTISGRASGLRFAANVGYRFRTRTRTVNLIVDDEITYRAAVALDLTPAGRRSFEAAVSLSGSTGAKVPFRKVPRNPLELLLGATYEAAPTVDAFAGGGAGLVAGYSAPDFRLFAGLRFHPADVRVATAPRHARRLPRQPADTDGDGLLDSVDSCPKQAEDKDGFEDGDGCPDPDNDNDSVLDVDDACPLDPEDIDGFEDDNGCPDPDNDQDQILDPDDKCPMVAESMNGFEDEDGCPEDIPDTDGDGLFDDKDQCVEEPEDIDQFEDADGCPDPDNDGDGVNDVADACPLQPGVAQNGGCPDSDRDGDSVVDRLDVCPDEPGSPEFSGCAKKQLVKLSSERIEILEKVYFDSGKDTIKQVSFALLDSVAKVLEDHPELQKIRVEGHTDSQGSNAFNLDLSQRRAASVVRYLTEKGIAAGRLLSEGYGEERPIASNRTAKGRATNRRVEFLIVHDDETGAEPTPEAKPDR